MPPSPSAAPRNALRMWTDGRDIFVEIPAKLPGPPTISRFPRTEGGLSKALSILCSIVPDYAGIPYTPTVHRDPKLDQAMAILKRNNVI